MRRTMPGFAEGAVRRGNEKAAPIAEGGLLHVTLPSAFA